jgi:hypothetical protein
MAIGTAFDFPSISQPNTALSQGDLFLLCTEACGKVLIVSEIPHLSKSK